MYPKIESHDVIRAHDFGQMVHGRPSCFLEGVVIEIEGDYIYFVVTKRVWDGKKEAVEPLEVGRTIINGASIMDDVDLPRVEKIGHTPPCFEIDAGVTVMLAEFKTKLREKGML